MAWPVSVTFYAIKRNEYHMKSIDKIRNVAIIAHIDHGKTTLIDSIFRAAHVFRRTRGGERIMDNNELERERAYHPRQALHGGVEGLPDQHH